MFQRLCTSIVLNSYFYAAREWWVVFHSNTKLSVAITNITTKESAKYFHRCRAVQPQVIWAISALKLKLVSWACTFNFMFRFYHESLDKLDDCLRLVSNLAWCLQMDAHLDAFREAMFDTRWHWRPSLLLCLHSVRLVGLGVVLEACLEQDAGTMLAARRRRVVSNCRACQTHDTNHIQSPITGICKFSVIFMRTDMQRCGLVAKIKSVCFSVWLSLRHTCFVTKPNKLFLYCSDTTYQQLKVRKPHEAPNFDRFPLVDSKNIQSIVTWSRPQDEAYVIRPYVPKNWLKKANMPF